MLEGRNPSVENDDLIPQSIIYPWVWKYHFFPLKEVEISHSLLNKLIKKL
jgi:hypothetical protein